MKGHSIVYCEHRNYVTSTVILPRELSHSAPSLHTKVDYACDVITMFEMNYTISFHGISSVK